MGIRVPWDGCIKRAGYILRPPPPSTFQNHALPLENAAMFKVFSRFWSLMGPQELHMSD